MRTVLALCLMLATTTAYTQDFLQFSKWNGSQWTPYARGAHGIQGGGSLNAMVIDSDGRIFAGGAYLPFVPYEWTGSDWRMADAAPYKFGNGYFGLLCLDSLNNVYSASTFSDTSDANSLNWRTNMAVLRWNGSSWQVVGTPLQTNPYNANARSTVSGQICCDRKNTLYIEVNNFFGKDRHALFRYNGTSWDTIPSSGIDIYSSIECMVSDSHNNILISGFRSDSTAPIGVMKWDGSKWSSIGFDGTFSMTAIAPNAGNGSFEISVDEQDNIYCDSEFMNAHGNLYIAKWDGQHWAEVGTADHFSGISYFENLVVLSSHSMYLSEVDANSNVVVWHYNGSSWSQSWISNDANADGFLAADKYGNLYFASDSPVADKVTDDAKSSLFLQPNPATDFVHVRVAPETGQCFVQLLNDVGSVVFETVADANTSINLSTIAPGAYTVLVRTHDARRIYHGFLRVLR